MITPQQLTYLKRLDRFLLTIPPEKFDLSYWAKGDQAPKSNFKCNTSGCAVGWGSVLFKEQGLFMEEVDHCPGHFGPAFIVHGIKLTNWTAVSEFFGITETEAFNLFLPGRYPDHDRTTARQVAWRIRAFIHRVENSPEYLAKYPKRKKVKRSKRKATKRMTGPDPILVKLKQLQEREMERI